MKTNAEIGNVAYIYIYIAYIAPYDIIYNVLEINLCVDGKSCFTYMPYESK